MKLKRWYVNNHWRVISVLGRGKDVLIQDLLECKGLLDAYSMFFYNDKEYFLNFFSKRGELQCCSYDPTKLDEILSEQIEPFTKEKAIILDNVITPGRIFSKPGPSFDNLCLNGSVNKTSLVIANQGKTDFDAWPFRASVDCVFLFKQCENLFPGLYEGYGKQVFDSYESFKDVYEKITSVPYRCMVIDYRKQGDQKVFWYIAKNDAKIAQTMTKTEYSFHVPRAWKISTKISNRTTHEYLHHIIHDMLDNNGEIFINKRDIVGRPEIMHLLCGNAPDFVIKKNETRSKTIIIDIYDDNEKIHEIKKKYKTLGLFADAHVVTRSNLDYLKPIFTLSDIDYLRLNLKNFTAYISCGKASESIELQTFQETSEEHAMQNIEFMNDLAEYSLRVRADQDNI